MNRQTDKQKGIPPPKLYFWGNCKSLIIRETLFSRGNNLEYIREILFSRFHLFCSTILVLEIIGEDFILASLFSRELTRK